MLLETLVVFVLILVAELVRRRWRSLQFFKERGIPGPAPHLLWGHYRELSTDHPSWIKKLSEEYGGTFGVFWGGKPFLVTGDLDIAKEVLIKQFPKFTNRGKQFALEDVHHLRLFAFVDDPPWRSLRKTLTPGFSSKKIKEMTPLVLRSIEGLECNLNKSGSKDEAFDIYPLLKRFAVDNIGRTIFGIDANTQAEPEVSTPLLKAALHATANFMGGYLDFFCNSFTSVNRVFGFVLRFLLQWHITKHAVSDMEVEMHKVIEARRDAAPRKDLLQSMLESQEISNDNSALAAREDIEDEKMSSETTSVQLTTEEVIGTSIALFLAGYDTTSSSLAHIFHCLGKYPDVQQRLRQEIEEALEGMEEPTYEIAMNLKYMDRVIRETLRLLPPATGFTTRRALSDVEVCGTRYPAGLAFYFPTKQIHTSPEYWDSPLTFDPDRFLQPLKHPLAYQPFGAGPRNCIGMRPALFFIKLTLCKIVPKFEFNATEDPKFKGVMIVTQPDRIMVTAKPIAKE